MARDGTGLTQISPRITALPDRVSRAPEQAKATTRANAPWRNWYSLARWRRIRAATFARDLYTCRLCGKLEGDTSKLVADHIKPHRGNETLFWDEANVWTICAPCHASAKQKAEQRTRHQVGVWD